MRLEKSDVATASGSSSVSTASVKGRIIHVSECLTDGVLTFLVDATRELATIGYSQTVLYTRCIEPPEDFRGLFDPSIEFLEMPVAPGKRIGMRQLASVLRQLVVDADPVAVHLHSFKAGLVGRAVLNTVKSRARCCYSPHGLAFLNSRRRLESLGYWVLESVAGWTKFQPVGSSRSEARLLEEVSRHSAILLENPVADDFFTVRRESHSELTVVSVGRASEQKAPDAFGELAVRCSFRGGLPVRFVWVGPADADQRVKLRAAGVEVTGWVTTEVVKQWLAKADVYVQTSRWEGLPLTVIQAMAVGLPCVVTDVVGNRDAIKNAHTGFVVGDQDTLERTVVRLLDDASLREKIGSSAKADAQIRFSRERFRTSLRALYGA